MTTLLGDVTGAELSVIKDPFRKDCITGVWMYFQPDIFTNAPKWAGWVEFTNGNSIGKQETPKVESFDELIIAMKQIFESIQHK